MGIKGLWTVLTPHSEKKSLHEIRGEKVAVDLSGWVCDSQNVTEYHVQPKLYLRNLFFRTIYLLLADIEPIFVLEGDAPELKRDVMAARNALQFRGAAPRSDTATKKPPDVARKRFTGVLKECESLLKCMGVRCIKGSGEAEATCAQLNAQGLVDAVVSQDSDCFAYGARRVYRNFSVSSAAGGGAMQGSIDCYDADVMFRRNDFGRNKMVALALLCGCDYGVGACGSSIATVVSFLHTVPDDKVITRLLNWVADPDYYEEQSRWLAVPGRCERCGHAGKTHTRNGCPTCVTNKGCTDTGHKAKVAEIKREIALRNRALSCGSVFPEPNIMNEFLHLKWGPIDLESLKKPAPSLIQFMKMMSKKLDWSERYCVEKFLPLLTKWHLQEVVPSRTIKPVAIKKKRTPKGVPSYEVVWEDIDGQYDALIPDDQFEEDEDRSKPWTSIERQDLMRQFYPQVVDDYEESIKKPVKEKKTRAKKKQDTDNTESTTGKPKRQYNKKVKKLVDLEVHNLSVSMNNLSMAKKDTTLNSSKVSVKVNKLKRKMKPAKGKQKTIDSFIANKRRKSIKKMAKKSIDNLPQIDHYYGDLCPEDKLFDEIYENEALLKDDKIYEKEVLVEDNKENQSKHLLSMLDDTNDTINESDLSDIVERIVSRAPTVKTAEVNNKLVKLVFETKYATPVKKKHSLLREIHKNCSTPYASPKQNGKSFKPITNTSFTSNNVNTSFFFDKLTDNCDAFEQSVEYIQNKSDVENCDKTVDYSLPDVYL